MYNLWYLKSVIQLAEKLSPATLTQVQACLLEDLTFQAANHIFAWLYTTRRQPEATGGIVCLRMEKKTIARLRPMQDITDLSPSPINKKSAFIAFEKGIAYFKLEVLACGLRPFVLQFPPSPLDLCLRRIHK